MVNDECTDIGIGSILYRHQYKNADGQEPMYNHQEPDMYVQEPTYDHVCMIIKHQTTLYRKVTERKGFRSVMASDADTFFPIINIIRSVFLLQAVYAP